MPRRRFRLSFTIKKIFFLYLKHYKKFNIHDNSCHYIVEEVYVMKKIIGILICMLFILCGFSYSVVPINLNKNSQLDGERVLTNTDAPLTIRVEAKQMGYRIWLLKAYLKNNWDEKIFIKSNLPCCFAVRYIYPNLEDFKILVFYPYRKLLPQFIPVFNFFKPGEEKLVEIAIFCGVSNYIIPLLADNITKYIESFPVLPEGDYIFEASINPYYVNSSDSQYGAFHINDTVLFHLDAPK